MLEAFSSIKLSKNGDSPLNSQLYDKLKLLVESGILLPDVKLPSVRSMSQMLEINQVTVVTAFNRLENEGYIYKKPGSGTFVADMTLKPANSAGAPPGPLQDELYLQDEYSSMNSSIIKLDQSTVNFASATPTPDLFPVDNFKIVLNEVLERDKGNAFSYQDSQGFYPLRQSVAALLKNTGLDFPLDNIQIISGAQQGLDLISKALLRQGDCIITESPTYTGAIALFKSRGARIIDVQMNTDGPDMDLLEFNLKQFKPRIIYTIPSFQNPTGSSYSMEKRTAVLELAEKYQCYIIEDDYVSDLDFDGRNYKALKVLDKYSRVIFIKSFSKLFMPGLRLGFMIVPSALTGNLLAAKHITDISTSGFIQRAFDLYIRKGYWDKHFNFMYRIFKERYEKTANALLKHIEEGFSFTRPGGGLNLWLGLPYGFPVNTLVKQAEDRNIVFAPGRIFYSGNSPQTINNIRLSFAAVYTEQIEAGIEALCSIMNRLHNSELRQRNLPIL